MNRIGWGALLACLAGAPALADTVVLDTGAVLEGEVTRAADGVRIAFSTGWSATIPDDMIERVSVVPGDQSANRVSRARGGRVARRIPVRAAQPAQPTRPASPEARALAGSIQASFQRGWRGQGERLIAEHPSALRWDQLDGRQGSVACAYDGRRMKVTLSRREADQDLVVAFTPGTYGRESDGQRYQDLVFLRAPVVVLPAGQRTAEVTVPVACARYGWSTPVPDMGYALERFPAGSDMDQLLVQLCAGAEAAPEEASQLAVWVVRNGLRGDQFEERHTTFESVRPILRCHGSRAAELIERSGVDPAAYPFFRRVEAPATATPPAAPQPEAPAEPVRNRLS